MQLGSTIFNENYPKGFDIARQKEAYWKAGIPAGMHNRLLDAWADYILKEGKSEV